MHAKHRRTRGSGRDHRKYETREGGRIEGLAVCRGPRVYAVIPGKKTSKARFRVGSGGWGAPLMSSLAVLLLVEIVLAWKRVSRRFRKLERSPPDAIVRGFVTEPPPSPVSSLDWKRTTRRERLRRRRNRVTCEQSASVAFFANNASERNCRGWDPG